ncbi:MAG TPA: hypothetical protein VFS05_12550 [Gemmatimonadaceae bacterium]|nr:hypothetical protein [Gemmatimonadaceae bacterium]
MPNRLICDAIRTRRLLMFGYGDAVRIVEPHLYGASAAGHELLSAWMRPGQSRVDPHGGWRSFRVDAMRELQMLPEHFAGARPGYNPHDEHVPTLFCRIEPEPAAPAGSPPDERAP